MATVTAPIMTDATGQSIDSKLNSLLGKMDNLAAAFQPNASGIVYSNTTSGLTGDDVQKAIDEMAADVSEIKSSLSDLLKTKTVSHSYSIAANGETHWNPTSDTDFPETGYIPIGVITFNCNNTNVCPTILAIGNSNWNMCLRNLSASTQANTFQYTVLYIKNFS